MDAASLHGSVLGEFRVHAVLGQGGSGIVYDAAWGPRRVALKVLHPSLLGDRVRAQFLEEARRLQAIAHPAVVKVLAFGELPDGRPFLAMERLEGETLAARLARGPLALADALVLFEELAHAISALHSQGLIHRDLKPENVFVVDGRHAVLLDFGIAKELAAPASTTTMDGGVRGTPAYMAPERFFGQPAGVATDLYELAVTFYAMLAGRLPWDDLADPEARLSPRPLVELASVPSELDIEIRRAMSTRAQNRPASAQAFCEAVRAAIASASEHAPADTARMAPAAAVAPSAVQPSPFAQQSTAGGERPWFADRQASTDRGKTPLAWAPTEAAPPRTPPAPRRRWPFAVGAFAVVGVGAGIAAWRLSGNGPTGASVPPAMPAAALAIDAAGSSAAVDPSDPWANTPPLPAVKHAFIPIDDSVKELSTEQARAEVAKAIQHVPADTRVLFTVVINELRAHEQLDEILGKVKDRTEAQQLLAAAPCIEPILAGAQWAVYAAKSLHDSTNGTLIVRGRWKRADVESCLSDDIVPLQMPDGAKLLQLRRVGWIDFIDEHTAYVSVRDDLAAAQVHALVTRGSGPAAHTRALFDRLPKDRTSAFVIDGTGPMKWPEDHLPAGSDASGWIRLDPKGGAAFDIVADTHAVATARQLHGKVKPTFDDLFKDKASSILGEISVTHAKTTMRIQGTVTPLLIAMIASQI